MSLELWIRLRQMLWACYASVMIWLPCNFKLGEANHNLPKAIITDNSFRKWRTRSYEFRVMNLASPNVMIWPFLRNDHSWFAQNSSHSHSLKLALYRVNLGLSARLFGGFDRLFPLYLWSLRKNGIKMVSMIPPGKHSFSMLFIIP